MSWTHRLNQVGCACVPEAALGVLAGLRREPGVVVSLRRGEAWVRWPPGQTSVLAKLLPVPGVRLYVRGDALWYAVGHRLPSFEVPEGLEDDEVSLSAAIVPEPIPLTTPSRREWEPVSVRLVRDDQARPASAVCCRLESLSAWAELATSAQFEDLEAAHDGDRVLIRGRTLPPIADSARFWGGRLLIPLGFRVEPDLPVLALLRSFGADSDDLVIVDETGIELVPETALRPLSRASLRLASEGNRG
jgi:hypothetical protein